MLESSEHGHLNDEQIVQFVLEMAGDEEAKHVEGCELCRGEAESYGRTLSHLGRWNVPERIPDYGSEVWRKVRPHVQRRTASRKLGPGMWGWASLTAVAAIVALALLLNPRQVNVNPPPTAALSEATPERLLQVAVKDHVERAALLLSQIETGAHKIESQDLRAERQTIGDLVAENRLYRQTAEQEDDWKTAGLLSDLETTLVALKHDPQRVSAAEARDLRDRLIKAEGLNRAGARDVSSSDLQMREVKRVPL